MAVMVMENVSLDVANVNRDMVEKIVAKVTPKFSGFCKISNLEILRSKFKNQNLTYPSKFAGKPECTPETFCFCFDCLLSSLLIDFHLV